MAAGVDTFAVVGGLVLVVIGAFLGFAVIPRALGCSHMARAASDGLSVLNDAGRPSSPPAPNSFASAEGPIARGVR
jgi:hypothetical protein